ncbi:MAG: hypothetical protein J0H66_01160 [Solirubrobacterales bacterium]|nr:hypothetical protein [Solirubrobacterales bacterium]OJU94250.1 MAG: hypothetical protein BGO23_02175 [Solirubrobacterales bacterium 67-14]
MGSRSLTAINFLDLIVLVLALPVFVVAGFDLAGYAVAAVVWLAQRGIQLWAEHQVKVQLAAGERTRAMGAIAGTSLVRPWLMAAVVLVACIIDREIGLYAAALLVVLFTVNLAARGLAFLLGKTDKPEEAA